MTVETDEEIKVFGTKKKPIRFKLDAEDTDVLMAAPKVPGQVMLDLIEKHRTLKEAAAAADTKSSTRGFTVAMEMFESVLFEDSMEVIRKRMSDKENPIDLSDILNIFNWLMGDKYGLRPTRSASSSSEESEDSTEIEGDGTTLTDGALPGESTPENSVGTASSTLPTTGSDSA